ncbi:MAG: Asp-tRNA(Asn)/Glu-tRNA(Gln) amidotransferase subunit GatA [Marinagarivorans sp.]|nr:Asp-tRNA(Asn)/Glu-tRNA(Gln) amidotransferase subunit GatA [Marinagarivorans sp.]
MHNHTLAQLVKQLQNKTVSSVELTQHFLDRIKQYDGELNSFITVTAEQALAQAKAADVLLAKGNAPALCGLPIAHKDNFCTQGVRTSCASKMLDNFIAPYNATIVENYLAQGVVSLGKTNMDEFAMGSSSETSYYGAVKNPWVTNCVPGGSSGGSAAAVAARLVPAATASDTGGSIRQPAALCGISGLKPTYGRVSRYGMIAYASSLDQAGLIARSAEDIALLLGTLASHDPKDSTSINRPVDDYTSLLNQPLKGLRVGIPEEYFSEGLNAAIEKCVREAIAVLEQLGATTKAIRLPNTGLSVPAYYVIAPAEASANLSRFDGVRYGHRCDNPQDLEDLYCRSRSEGFGDEVKRRILVGAYALSAGYYDAYFGKAQKARRLIQQDFVAAFNDVDVIVGPTTPSPAFEAGSKIADPVAMYLEDIYTIATNLAGLPGMSIPCGFVDGKPVGLQIIGNYFSEAQMLGVAHQYQSATDFHTLAPASFS